jgi:hypothetical protein
MTHLFVHGGQQLRYIKDSQRHHNMNCLVIGLRMFKILQDALIVLFELNILLLLVGGFKQFLFSIIYGIILPIDFHVFQRG